MAAGCSRDNVIRIGGRVENTGEGYLFINRVEVDTPVRLDSVRINGKGVFSYRIEAAEPEFYQVGRSASDFITILAEPGERIKLSFTGNTLYEDYFVEGSPGTSKLKMLDSALARTHKKIDSLKILYEKSYNTPGFEEEGRSIDEAYVRLLKEQRLFNIDFILKNLRSLASIKALYQRIDENTYVLYDARDLQFMKLVSDTLTKYYPNSKQVKSVKINFENEKNQLLINRIDQLAKDAPETRLDPSLKDMDGKIRTLSSLKGKYVLVSFWSAASQDCIRENLELKSLYSKYNKQGFEVYQINLDMNEDNWKKAVNFDELPWISVREDDPANPKYATLFNVRVLPANYLFDRKGEIVAMNLHGRSLQIKLNQIFGE